MIKTLLQGFRFELFPIFKYLSKYFAQNLQSVVWSRHVGVAQSKDSKGHQLELILTRPLII